MRHIVVLARNMESADGAEHILDQSQARNEAELQMKMRDHPELLPVEDLDVGVQALVVGRETRLPSGRPDLLLVSDSGDLIIVEMKRGPENGDFRRALAQLIDYGSDLWRMSIDEFERQVAVPYFTGPQCHKTSAGRGASTIREALEAWLPRDEETDVEGVLARLKRDLRTGAFTYVLAAQSFTPAMERSMEYLNDVMKEARFYGVELAKFGGGGGMTAFEGRTVIAPPREKVQQSEEAKSDELLEGFSDSSRPIAERIVDAAGSFGMIVFRGVRGFSLKVPVADREAPLSVAWLFPEGGATGPFGSQELTLGYQTDVYTELPTSQEALRSYRAGVGALKGGREVASEKLDGVILRWHEVTDQVDDVMSLLEAVTASASAGR